MYNGHHPSTGEPKSNTQQMNDDIAKFCNVGLKLFQIHSTGMNLCVDFNESLVFFFFKRLLQFHSTGNRQPESKRNTKILEIEIEVKPTEKKKKK